MGTLICRPMAGHLAWRAAQQREHSSYGLGYPKKLDWEDAIFKSIFLSIIWPITLIAYIPNWLKIRIGAERTAYLQIQKERIEQLERELELR